jgi:hypothetical protein
MSPQERKDWVARRDPEKVRAADRVRYKKDKPNRRKAMDEYAASNRERVNGHKKAWVERNPEKHAAHVAVSNALRDGRLVKGPCERASEGGCGRRIEAHHDDYEKPLEVRWLCSKHHAETRKKVD